MNVSVNNFSKDKLAFMKFIDVEISQYDKPIELRGQIISTDAHFAHISAAKKNAKIAGVVKQIQFSRKELEWLDTKLGKKIEKLGAGFILFSSVEADGAFIGPDIKNIEKMVNSVKIPVYAAGGVRNEEDIVQLQKIGVHGVIVGKAFYEHKLSSSIVRNQ